jgi:hypothetical protein
MFWSHLPFIDCHVQPWHSHRSLVFTSTVCICWADASKMTSNKYVLLVLQYIPFWPAAPRHLSRNFQKEVKTMRWKDPWTLVLLLRDETMKKDYVYRSKHTQLFALQTSHNSCFSCACVNLVTVWENNRKHILTDFVGQTKGICVMVQYSSLS